MMSGFPRATLDEICPVTSERCGALSFLVLASETQVQRQDEMALQKPIPVIDLFAGPGGLGEGFSSLIDKDGNRRFALRVSIEKDPIAHRTLSLRALFRYFPKGKAPDCYYDYVRGKIGREQLFAHPDIPDAAREAALEAKNAELGKTPHEEIDGWIETALDGSKEWVLIGGPPCQAYSVAGRSRRTKESTEAFEKDEKHFLYKEYLRIIENYEPSIFVMENVKGILSTRHGGAPLFDRILADLSSPRDGLTYRIRSFVVPKEDEELDPKDFVIEAERFGVPQNRHRVILFGIRSDVRDAARPEEHKPGRFVLPPSAKTVSVKTTLNDLPSLRSRLSKEPDTIEKWLSALAEAPGTLAGWDGPDRQTVQYAMKAAADRAIVNCSHGEPFIPGKQGEVLLPEKHREWFLDGRLGGVIQHETRSHMRSDLHRYLFAACFAQVKVESPKLEQFPVRLLPEHLNVNQDDPEKNIPFSDRFRVQMASGPSTTVVAHIAKDGHYYIHYDPSQCRSLTVREAARLQTFPDNYFFEGNRTEQYHQVGNAVPPWLAKKLATIVLDFIEASRPRKPRP
jgi:DNA (cytosine-5)-methyltransferase 1